MVKQVPTQADACPICLTRIANPASPDSCSHFFCHKCIKKWSAKQSTCPLCKNRFTSIHKRKHSPDNVRTRKDARSVRKENVGGSQRSQEDLMEENLFNALSGGSTRAGEHSMLMAYAYLQEMTIEE